MRLCVAVLLLTISLTVPAQGAAPLTVSRAKREIRPVFFQELAWSGMTVSRRQLAPCNRNSPRMVTCHSRVTFTNGLRCKKLYRARLAFGEVSIKESADGRRFTRYARSSCS